MYPQSGNVRGDRFQGFGGALERDSGQARLSFLRRVYGLFFGGIVSASLGAVAALYVGAESGPTAIIARKAVQVPPMVALVVEHPIIVLIAFFGAFFGVQAVRTKPTINVAALFGFTFLTGLLFAPSLFIATALANGGHTLSANPVRDAFLLATAAFGGLTGYAMVSKKDFSFLGGFLSMGIIVLIVASLIGMFVGGEVLQLGIASVGVILFGAYVLYDTSRLLRTQDRSDPVSAALSLFLDFLNLFMFILRILMSSRRD